MLSFFEKVESSSCPGSQPEPTATGVDDSNTAEQGQSSGQSNTHTLDQNISASVEGPQQETVVTTETYYIRDPGKRLQIWQIPTGKQDEARRFYISEGAYQPILQPVEYPFAGKGSHRRRFQKDWFTNHFLLEYSPETHKAYCLPSFLFSKKPIGRCGSDTFTVKGFQNWKKVNNGKECAFLTHMGRDPNSAHNFVVRCFENLKNIMSHIDKVMVKQCEKRVADARLRLKTTIDAIR